MAYTSTSTKTLTVGGKAYGDASGYDTSATAKLTVTTSGSTISWKVTMTTSGGPYLYLYLKIGSKVIFKDYYANNPSNYGPTGFVNVSSSAFPRGNGSSKSGSFTYTGDSKPAINLWVAPSVWLDMSKSDTYNYGRGGYKGTTTISDMIHYTNVGVGTVTDWVDNKDNSFTFSGTKGKAGTNNSVKTAYIWHSIEKNKDWNKTYDKSEFKVWPELSDRITVRPTVGIFGSDLTTSDTRTVAAAVTTVGTYGTTSDTGWKTFTINQYVPPTVPGKPGLSSNSFSGNSRLTNRRNWTYTWTASTKRNNTSPVAGYRIQIRKNGVSIAGLQVNSDGYTIKKSASSSNYIDGVLTNKIVFNPVDFGFKPGDRVSVAVLAYSLDGKNNKYGSGLAIGDFNGERATSNPMKVSDETIVQNAGVVRPKVDGTWREGIVHVKVKDTWKEAEAVYIKANGQWHESQ